MEKIQAKRPDLALIHLADGAQDHWTFFDDEMPNGFQLVDFYHACGDLHKAFEAADADDCDKAAAQFEKYRRQLQEDDFGAIKTLTALRYLRTKHPQCEAINVAVRYFTHNQHRMDDAKAKQLNYPIGSGVVEAACKT